MTLSTYVFPTQDCTQVGGNVAALKRYYVVTLTADLPTVFSEGSLAYDEQANIYYVALAANVWTPIAGGSAGASNVVIADRASETGGEFTTSSTSFVLVTGTELSFTLPKSTVVMFDVQFTPRILGASDGNPVAHYRLAWTAGAGSNQNLGIHQSSITDGTELTPLHFNYEIELTAGAITAELQMKVISGITTGRIQSSTDAPTVITAWYVG